jgi:hypothetical protein
MYFKLSKKITANLDYCVEANPSFKIKGEIKPPMINKMQSN